MAAFREHVTFSTVLGVGYAVGLKSLGADGSHALLAGAFCGVAGMLPDLDSDSGKPVKELFGLMAAAGALLCFHRLGSGDLEFRLLLATGMYLMIRFGFSYIVKKLTVHRGMCHSIPAALIAALGTFLACDQSDPKGALGLAGGVLLGFLSHLLLDEIYAVDISGLKVKLNQFAGSAMKLFSKSMPANIVTWGLLLFLAYRTAVCQGYVTDSLPTVVEMRSMRDSVFDKLGISKGKSKLAVSR